MAIGEVVHGTTALVDSTSDTVDAAHPAKGRTARDAGGNPIAGTLEQRADGDIPGGIAPIPPNGATQGNRTHAIPEGGTSGTGCIGYRPDIPESKPDTVRSIPAYGKTQEGYRPMAVEPVFDRPCHGKPHGGTSSVPSPFPLGTSGAAKAGSLGPASGGKPTRPVSENADGSAAHPLDISGIMGIMPEA